MPKMNKVYCQKCRWLKSSAWYTETHRCDHPSNLTDSFLAQNMDRKETAKRKNGGNDCKDFSPIEDKPESLISKLTLGLIE